MQVKIYSSPPPMGVKLGLSHSGRNIDWRFSRTGCWERSWT